MRYIKVSNDYDNMTKLMIKKRAYDMNMSKHCKQVIKQYQHQKQQQ